VSQTPPPQPPYGPPNQYGGPGFGPMVPDHPQSVTVLILGIVSVAVCGVVGPFAWVMGNRVVREIEASNGQLGGHSQAQAGRIMGIITTCLLGLSLIAGAGFVIFALIAVATSST
jgi:uncharacterized membrane protein YjgN (DUF898 family)